MRSENPLSLFDITGKAALITGASGAFGALAAQCLSGAGCRVALAGGNAAKISRISAACAGPAVEINARPDSEESCAGMVARTVAEFGKLDILVVASGMNKVARIDEMPAETFDEVINANVTQSWLIARAATRQMKAQGHGGKIVLMSSARGLLGHPAGYTAYCASKAAVDGITRALGCEARCHRNNGQCDCSDRVSIAPDGVDVRGFRKRTKSAGRIPHARSKRQAGRTGRSGRAAPVPVFTGVRLLHRTHSLRRWRIYGWLSDDRGTSNCCDWCGAHGPRDRTCPR